VTRTPSFHNAMTYRVPRLTRQRYRAPWHRDRHLHSARKPTSTAMNSALRDLQPSLNRPIMHSHRGVSLDPPCKVSTQSP